MSESEDGKKLLTGPDGKPLTGVIRSVAISDFALNLWGIRHEVPK